MAVTYLLFLNLFPALYSYRTPRRLLFPLLHPECSYDEKITNVLRAVVDCIFTLCGCWGMPPSFPLQAQGTCSHSLRERRLLTAHSGVSPHEFPKGPHPRGCGAAKTWHRDPPSSPQFKTFLNVQPSPRAPRGWGWGLCCLSVPSAQSCTPLMFGILRICIMYLYLPIHINRCISLSICIYYIPSIWIPP